MFEKSLNALEYNKIIEKLSGYATGEKTRKLIYELKPETDFDIVEQSLKETDNALVAILKYGNPPSCGYNEQDKSVKRAMAGGTLNIKELLSISAIIRVCTAYKNYIEDHSEFPVLSEYLCYIYDYSDIEKRIESAILNEDELSDNASNELYSIRKSIKSLNDKIRTTLNNYITSEKYSKYLQEQIVTTRGGRYVIPVRAEYKGDIGGLVHDTSSTGATLFIEPASIVEANNKLKELETEEKREIERILKEFSKEIAEIGESLLVNFEFVEKLDFAFSKGKFALELNAVKPVLNKDKVIDLKKARHPLIDKKKVVPIDVSLGKEFDTLIVTGPNTGGKTVSIKTVGLFVLMTQSGLLIPASVGSQIGIFKNVFADIGDEQSIEQSLSTFSSHMTNIVSILDNFDGESLVLFDELGAGTDPVEGAALAIAVIEEIRKNGAKVMATTHYSELKVYAMTTDGISNASCEFDVETLRPTYKLIIGVPGKSNAFAISEKLGLSKKIIDNATNYISGENLKFEDVLKELDENRIVAEREREKAEKYLKELNEQKKYIEKEKAETEKLRREILTKAEEKANEITENATKETENLIAEITRLRTERKEKEALKELENMRKELKSKTAKYQRKKLISNQNTGGKVLEDVLPGTYVYVVDTDTNGEVLTKPDKKGNVMVQTGILKITVPLSALRLAEKKEGEQEAKRYAMTREFSAKSSEISPEIDLRGMYAQEAVDKAEKFIDDAAVSSLKNVTIVHGKGTGALKNAIHEMLKTNRFVKSFRLGVYGEGDNGVTVVELK